MEKKLLVRGYEAGKENHKLFHAIQFLTRLNANFVVAKSQIFLMEPLSNMNKIFSMVLQHEKQGKFASVEGSQALINIVEFKKPTPKHGNSKALLQYFKVQELHSLW